MDSLDTLALTLPPSVLRKVTDRIARLKLDSESDEAKQITTTLVEAYERKKEKARLASSARRARLRLEKAAASAEQVAAQVGEPVK